jgi:IS30 family transposase
MPVRKLTEQDKREIQRMKQKGIPEYKIAAIIGVAPYTIRFYLKNHVEDRPETIGR